MKLNRDYRFDMRICTATAKVFLVCLLSVCFLVFVATADAAWKRHAVDNTSKGADGVRLMDVNGDGLMDIATGWEEGGVVRAYLHPGKTKVKQAWPTVTVGRVKSAEDAVFVDLDGDGAVDVVSSCEGRTKTMFVHWAPKEKSKYLDGNSWQTEAIPATVKKQSWMFCLPMDVDGKNGIDLVVSSKGSKAVVGVLLSPENPRDLKAWQYKTIYDAGWIMSLQKMDVNGDGFADVIASDRKGKNRGVLWLKHPGKKQVGAIDRWQQHRLGGENSECMFVDSRLVVKSGEKQKVLEVVVPVKSHSLLLMKQLIVKEGKLWKPDSTRKPVKITVPSEQIGRMKGVRYGKGSNKGGCDFFVTCESANAPRFGVYGLIHAPKTGQPNHYKITDIAGPRGVKFDRIELIDLDGDGDQDILTCEERDQLGVIWYENPGN